MTTTQPTDQATVPTYQLLWLDPTTLLAHNLNPRTDLGDLTELTDSIRANGVLEPCVVVPVDPDRYGLVAGHRRVAAAIAADQPTVPCILRTDLAATDDDNAGQARHIAAMLQENILRAALTPIEQAAGIQQMLDLGVNVTQVVKTTGFTRKHVVKAVAANRLPAEAKAAATDLTLDQLAAVSEFHDDPDATAALLEAAEDGPGQFAHELTRQKQDRKRHTQVQAAADELAATGCRILTDDDTTPSHNGATNRYLSGLSIGPDSREPLTPELHATCPGRAATVTEIIYGDPPVRINWVCTDPFTHGHGERWGAADTTLPDPGKLTRDQMTDEQAEAAREERRRVITNNKAMDAANITRRAWIKEFLHAKTTPKSVLRFAVETFALDPAGVEWWFGLGGSTSDADDAVRALGLTRPSRWQATLPTLTSAAGVPDNRLPLQLLAHIAAGYEGTIGRSSWRDARQSHARWLRFLEANGYTLAAVEHELIGLCDAAAEKVAERTATREHAAGDPQAAPADVDPDDEADTPADVDPDDDGDDDQ